MSIRRPLVVRHGGTSLRLKSLRRAARDPARTAGFLALMRDVYPVRPDLDADFAPSTADAGLAPLQTA